MTEIDEDTAADGVVVFRQNRRSALLSGALIALAGVAMISATLLSGNPSVLVGIAGGANLFSALVFTLNARMRLRLDAEGARITGWHGRGLHVPAREARVQVDPDDDRVPLMITAPDQAKPLIVDPRAWEHRGGSADAVVRGWAHSHGIPVVDSPEPAALRRRGNRMAVWLVLAVLAVSLTVATIVGQLA